MPLVYRSHWLIRFHSFSSRSAFSPSRFPCKLNREYVCQFANDDEPNIGNSIWSMVKSNLLSPSRSISLCIDASVCVWKIRYTFTILGKKLLSQLKSFAWNAIETLSRFQGFILPHKNFVTQINLYIHHHYSKYSRKRTTTTTKSSKNDVLMFCDVLSQHS